MRGSRATSSASTTRRRFAVRRSRGRSGNLLPHLIPLAAVYAAAIAGIAVITDGFLSWFSLTSTRFNLGTIAYKALAFRGIMGGMPWLPMTAAAAAITLFGLSFFLMAAGIRRALR